MQPDLIGESQTALNIYYTTSSVQNDGTVLCLIRIFLLPGVTIFLFRYENVCHERMILMKKIKKEIYN